VQEEEDLAVLVRYISKVEKNGHTFRSRSTPRSLASSHAIRACDIIVSAFGATHPSAIISVVITIANARFMRAPPSVQLHAGGPLRTHRIRARVSFQPPATSDAVDAASEPFDPTHSSSSSLFQIENSSRNLRRDLQFVRTWARHIAPREALEVRLCVHQRFTNVVPRGHVVVHSNALEADYVARFRWVLRLKSGQEVDATRQVQR